MTFFVALNTALLVATSHTPTPSSTQPTPQPTCPTVLQPANIPTLRTQSAAGAYHLPQPTSDTLYIPLTFHIVRTSDGTGGLPPQQICGALDDLDTYFAATDIQFYLAGPLDFIDNDTFYYDIDTPAEIDQLRSTNPIPGTINLYFTPHLANQNGEFCGISSFTWSPVQGIVMHNACTAVSWNHTTLPHEMGHYFDLLHTHETATGHECVNGSKCQTAGDLLCDTPADPGLSSDNLDGCVYVGDERDPCRNDPYAPEPANLMSSATPSCRSLFTPDQTQRARATLLNLRPELVHYSLPAPYDCNNNGIRDDCDIASGSSDDLNANGIPDECDLPGDIDGDGRITSSDFQLFITALAGPGVTDPPPGCDPAVFTLSDLNHDAAVDLPDYAQLQTTARVAH